MKGSASEFEQAFAAHYPRVFRHAYSLCGNRADAEDIAQEVFVGVMKGLSGFRGDAEMSTWIYQITTRVAGRYLARRSRFKSAPAQSTVQPLEDGSVEDDVSVVEFMQAMNSLTLAQRTILSLVSIEGLSHQAAADVLGIPVGTVWSRLHLARKQLAKSLS